MSNVLNKLQEVEARLAEIHKELVSERDNAYNKLNAQTFISARVSPEFRNGIETWLRNTEMKVDYVYACESPNSSGAAVIVLSKGEVYYKYQGTSLEIGLDDLTQLSRDGLDLLFTQRAVVSYAVRLHILEYYISRGRK